MCESNPDAVLELAADGTLIAMTPTGGETSSRNGQLLYQLQDFCRRRKSWRLFDSSGGFDAQGEQLVLYSCWHGYAHRAHAICDLQPKVVNDAFAKAEHQLGQGLRVQSSAA